MSSSKRSKHSEGILPSYLKPPRDLSCYVSFLRFPAEDYQIISVLAQAIHGCVLLGIHIRSNTRVAIKKMNNPAFTNISPAQLEHPMKEIGALRFLCDMWDSEFICQLFEIYRDEEHTYAIFELAEGGELFQLVSSREYLEEIEARVVMHQILRAVKSVHSGGLCHRDVSLENILVHSNGTMRLTDFGQCVPMYSPAGTPCLFSGIAGKVSYRAPEMTSGQYYEGGPADIFACGVLLFILVIGSPPWKSPVDTDQRYCLIQTKGTYSLLKRWKRVDRASRQLCKLIDEMVRDDPRQRPKIGDVLDHPWFAEPGYVPTKWRDSHTPILTGISETRIRAERSLYMTPNTTMSFPHGGPKGTASSRGISEGFHSGLGILGEKTKNGPLPLIPEVSDWTRSLVAGNIQPPPPRKVTPPSSSNTASLQQLQQQMQPGVLHNNNNNSNNNGTAMKNSINDNYNNSANELQNIKNNHQYHQQYDFHNSKRPVNTTTTPLQTRTTTNGIQPTTTTSASNSIHYSTSHSHLINNGISSQQINNRSSGAPSRTNTQWDDDDDDFAVPDEDFNGDTPAQRMVVLLRTQSGRINTGRCAGANGQQSVPGGAAQYPNFGSSAVGAGSRGNFGGGGETASTRYEVQRGEPQDQQQQFMMRQQQLQQGGGYDRGSIQQQQQQQQLQQQQMMYQQQQQRHQQQQQQYYQQQNYNYR